MLGLLKCFSSIGAIIMLLVGLLFTGITVYAFINQDVFVTEQDIKHIILNSLLTVSSVLIVIAVLGIIGVVRKICCLILLYQVFILIFLGIFLSLGVGSSVLPGKIFQGNCTSSSNSFIAQANQLYQKSDAYFCQSECPCSMTNNSLSKYSQFEQRTLNQNYTIRATGVIATQNCENIRNWTNKTTIALIDSLRQVQNLFQCSDWCEGSSQNLFYRFSNVNDGKPKNFCYTILKDSLFHYSGVVGITSYIIAATLLLVCVCNICLCCHPDRKKLQFRDRFVYIPQRPDNRRYQHIAQ